MNSPVVPSLVYHTFFPLVWSVPAHSSPKKDKADSPSRYTYLALLSPPVGSNQTISCLPYSFVTFEEIKVALALKVHFQFSFLTISEPSSISKPLLFISPTFLRMDLKPVIVEIGTSCSRLFESLLKYSNVPKSLLLNNPNSNAMLVW
ncbi:hypothetical protein D3C81_1422840 [compost metagenome]